MNCWVFTGDPVLALSFLTLSTTVFVCSDFFHFSKVVEFLGLHKISHILPCHLIASEQASLPSLRLLLTISSWLRRIGSDSWLSRLKLGCFSKPFSATSSLSTCILMPTLFILNLFQLLLHSCHAPPGDRKRVQETCVNDSIGSEARNDSFHSQGYWYRRRRQQQ